MILRGLSVMNLEAAQVMTGAHASSGFLGVSPAGSVLLSPPRSLLSETQLGLHDHGSASVASGAGFSHSRHSTPPRLAALAAPKVMEKGGGSDDDGEDALFGSTAGQWNGARRSASPPPSPTLSQLDSAPPLPAVAAPKPVSLPVRPPLPPQQHVSLPQPITTVRVTAEWSDPLTNIPGYSIVQGVYRKNV